MSKIKRILSLEFIRYVIIGFLAYVIEIASLVAFTRSGLSATYATAISFWIGLVIAFTLQKIVTFKDKSKDIKTLGGQSLIYLTLVVFNYSFTLAVVTVFNDDLVFFSRTLALVITTFWNFFIYKHLFKGDKKNNSQTLDLSCLDRLLVRLKNNWIFLIGPVVLIIVFFWQYVATGSRLIGGDFDYIAQLYEAFRLSVTEYGQFPSWNPWISGGVPLYANPQFGLFSLQSLLVLIFGTIYGLKMAYVAYAIFGYIGTYLLFRLLKVEKLRSALVGLIWVFGGFFAGHSISHFTFSSFYLFPWVLLFIVSWKKRFSWVGLGSVLSIIVLSSFHYAFLMIGLGVSIFSITFILLLTRWKEKSKRIELTGFLIFLIKGMCLFLLISGHRILTTFLFVNSNTRPSSLLSEIPPEPTVLLQALFLPVGTLLRVPAGLQWGWGEYSSYMGFGVTLSLLVIVIGSIILYAKKSQPAINKQPFIIAILVVGILSFLLALGEFNRLSPYNILREIPGFSQTRVSSRWLIFVSFSLLSAIALWKKNRFAINVLLVFAVLELFIAFGPVNRPGTNQASIPDTKERNTTIMQYDTRDMKRGEVEKNLDYSYFYSTQRNIGQIYADDSIVNTLNRVIGTQRCGQNVDPKCDLVLSDNAEIKQWSPNRIVLHRTASGPIELNMNADSGWRINNRYLFASLVGVNPDQGFTINDSPEETYDIVYSPKFSPSWITWKIAI